MNDYHILIRKTTTNHSIFAPLHDAFKAITLPTHCSMLIANFYLLLSTFFIFITSHSFATILTVKQDGTGNFTNIQSAMNAASVGDTVLVWPGTYYENINFNGKDILIASLFLTTGDRQYISNTIIDGNHQESVVRFLNNETRNAEIFGFTLQNGSGHSYIAYGFRPSGGGIIIRESNPTISFCNITNNMACMGGGIFCMYGSFFIKGSIIKSNHAYSLWGGGIFVNSETSQIIFDTIHLNSIFCNFSSEGSDIFSGFDEPVHFKLDTFSISNPTYDYFIFNNDGYGVNNYMLTVDVLNGKIEQVSTDLYVNPKGNNANSGMTPDQPLKTICYALAKIKPDTTRQLHIFIDEGHYSKYTTGECFGLNLRPHVSLVGKGMGKTILDADYLGEFSKRNYIENIIFHKISFVDSYDTTGRPVAGFRFGYASNICFDSCEFSGTISSTEACIASYEGDTGYITNSTFHENRGYSIIRFGNTRIDDTGYFRFENLKIYQNGYGTEPESYGACAISCYNGLMEPVVQKFRIINVEITENESADGWSSAFQGPGIKAGMYCHVDIINMTSGYNTDVTGLTGTNQFGNPGVKVNMYNSILYHNNKPDIRLGPDPYNPEPPPELNIDYTNIEDGISGIVVYPPLTAYINFGSHNIDEDPQWDTFGTNPYSLMSNSPCINTGTPMYEPGMEPPYIKQENGKYILYTHGMDTIHLPATDLAGNPRIAYGRIDMGAYEFVDTTVGIRPPPKYIANGIKAIPNPFQQSTAIEFTLLKEGHCQVQVHDMQGRLIKTLLDAFTQPGNFQMRWHADDDNGNKIPSGHYIINVLFEGKNVGSEKVSRW